MHTTRDEIVPMRLAVIAGIGVLLLVIGVADWLGGAGLVPMSWRSPNYAQVMTAVGAVLMLGADIAIIRALLHRSRLRPQSDK